MKKISMVGLFAALVLSGCEVRQQEQSQKSEQEAQVSVIHQSKEIFANNKSILLGRAIYQACFNGNAYIIAAQNATSLIPILDLGNPVACKKEYSEGFHTFELPKTNFDRGVFSVCIAGYSFLAVSESKNSISLAQELTPEGKALGCFVEGLKFNKILFVNGNYEKIQVKYKELEEEKRKLLQNIQDENGTEQKIKIH